MRIFLVGYMGSGKTTVARKLALRLNFTFIDLDHYIEEKTGSSVSEIFEVAGEEKFRYLEGRYLDEVCEMERVVVATGGGTPCFGENMNKMKSTGMVVYLQMSIGALMNRLRNSKRERPLLKTISEGKMYEYIQGQITERDLYYKQANIIVNGESASADTLARLVLNQEQ